MLILCQAAAIAVMLILAFAAPRLGSAWFHSAERWLGRMARRRGLSVALVGLLAVGLSAAVSMLVHMPKPRVNDEFSYMLAADTFAHGRLANPPHPMWVHFESIHIIQQPTYASKYPPAQGLMLAAGQVLAGHPIVGVWINTGLMCAAIYWMLLAWLPPKWALLGGLLVISHLGILLGWGQSYWGGGVAATGGALVFGALRRIMRRPHVGNALVMGTGLAILANSRPYEGLIVSIPAVIALLIWMVGGSGPSIRVSVWRVALPILAILMLTAGAIGFYNLRVTGNPLRLPYQVHEATYAMAPLFIWQSPRPEPKYHHTALRDYHMMHLEYYTRQCTVEQCSLSALVQFNLSRAERLWTFYLAPLLTLPLVMLPLVLKNRWMRFALLICLSCVAAFFLTPWKSTYNIAPTTGLIFVLVLQSMRYLSRWRWRGQPTGRFIMRAVPLTSIAFLVFWLAYLAFVQEMRVTPRAAWSLQRARMAEQLEQDGKRHLVLVRYGPGHSLSDEWVYNKADIDGANVVWAREMDAAQNQKLLEYFQDRHVWLVDADAEKPKLEPYPVESGFETVAKVGWNQ